MEIQTGKLLDHPFLVKIHDSLFNDGKRGLIMEYCDGDNFQKFIEARKNKNEIFNEEEIAKYLANITLGLNELHNNGFQHRDLKPLNILIHRVKNK